MGKPAVSFGTPNHPQMIPHVETPLGPLGIPWVLMQKLIYFMLKHIALTGWSRATTCWITSMSRWLRKSLSGKPAYSTVWVAYARPFGFVHGRGTPQPTDNRESKTFLDKPICFIGRRSGIIRYWILEAFWSKNHESISRRLEITRACYQCFRCNDVCKKELFSDSWGSASWLDLHRPL